MADPTPGRRIRPSSGHALAPIPFVATYFGDPAATPIITAHFRPESGWKRSTYRKRISRSWATKLRTEGVTHVQLTFGGRAADFSLDEVLRS